MFNKILQIKGKIKTRTQTLSQFSKHKKIKILVKYQIQKTLSKAKKPQKLTISGSRNLWISLVLIKTSKLC